MFHAWAPRPRRAFTIVEVLVAIGVVGILVGLLLPAVQAARGSARRSQCASNLHQIGVALQAYHARHQVLPPGYISQVDPRDADDLGPGFGWAALLLADLELADLKRSLDFKLPLEHPANRTHLLVGLPVFRCPSDDAFDEEVSIPMYDANPIGELAGANYVASVGTVRQTCKVCRDRFDGAFGRNSRTRLDHVYDGTTRTFAVGERNHAISSPVWAGVVARSMIIDNLLPGKVAGGPAYVLGSTFLHGDQEELEERSRETVAEIFSAAHGGILNFLYCDGSVRVIRTDIEDNVYLALSTTNDQRPGSGVVHLSPVFATPE